MDSTQFQNMIRRILLEEVEKRSVTDRDIYERLPEVVTGEDLKSYMEIKYDAKTKEEVLDTILKAVKPIDSSITVVWDDHDDISVSARDLFRVRIIPRWGDNYNIEAFIRNEDRIYVTNQHLYQVIEFLKVNLKNTATRTQTAYEKSKTNAVMKNDKTSKSDKGLPQKDKPKTLPHTDEPPKTTKNKDRNYTEKQVKNEKDLPNMPMHEVGNFKWQIEHKSRSPISIRKEKTKYPSKKPNTTLTIPISKQG